MQLKRASRKLSIVWIGIGAVIVLPLLLQLPDFSLSTLSGSILLASPFIIVGCAMMTRQLSAAGNAMAAVFMLTIIPWGMSLFLMGWFKPGVLGAAVLGGLMATWAWVSTLFIASFSACKKFEINQRAPRLLLLLLSLCIGGSIATELILRDRIKDDQACRLSLAQNSIDASGRPRTRASVMQDPGFISVCEKNLEPFELSSHPISRWLSKTPDFAPISILATPFAEYAAAGTWSESTNGIPSRLYRGFRTLDGLQVILMEHELSADGSRVTFPREADDEKVHGAVAKLTVMQAASGKAVSLLSWEEGSRLYTISVNININQTERKQWLLALATSLLPLIPARQPD